MGTNPDQRDDGVTVFRWFDHRGGIVEAPAPADGSRPTAWRWDDCRTHYMFGAPSSVPTMQALTCCGKRALEVPGRGEVDCAECLEVVNGADQDQPSAGSS